MTVWVKEEEGDGGGGGNEMLTDISCEGSHIQSQVKSVLSVSVKSVSLKANWLVFPFPVKLLLLIHVLHHKSCDSGNLGPSPRLAHTITL